MKISNSSKIKLLEKNATKTEKDKWKIQIVNLRF